MSALERLLLPSGCLNLRSTADSSTGHVILSQYQMETFQLASEILTWLEDSLVACKKETCKLVYLRALKNAGREAIQY